MSSLGSSLSRWGIMAAIVTTLCFPAGAALAWAASAVLGFPLRSLLTFGGSFNALAGAALWWTIGFVPALAYAAVFLPRPARAVP